MGLVWLRTRSEWRSRGWELMALTLLVALVGSVVLTTVSGARRTRSSVERLDRTTRAPDALMMFTAGGSTAAKAISALPEVEVADRLSPMSFFIERGNQPFFASVDGRIGDTMKRDRVLRGRRPHSTAPLEVALSEPVAQRLHLDVGSHLRVTGISQQQNACVFSENSQGDPRCVAIQKAFFANPPDYSVFAEGG